MKTSDVIDSLYIIPVLLEHFDKPTRATTEFLKHAGINEISHLNKLKKIRHLLQYHYHFVSTKTGNYPLLRKGLDEYFDMYLSKIFQLLGITGQNMLMFDIGSGTGCYSNQFLKDNPEGVVIAVDREHPVDIPPVSDKFPMAIDFDKNPDWYIPHSGTADIVLMSELLHCKTAVEQKNLIYTAAHLLKPGGMFIVNENLDYAMQYRISKLKGQFHSIVTPESMAIRTKNAPLNLLREERIQNHIIYLYEKV